MMKLREKIASASFVELSASVLFICCAVLCIVMIVRLAVL